MRTQRQGFALVEILIVVVILGVLAALVVPQFADAANSAKKSAFVADLRNLAQAAERYMNDTGELIEDSSTGSAPAALADYINIEKFEDGTVLGGEWDFEQNSFGVQSAVGVDFDDGEADPALMLEIDAMIDDGNLSTGGFRQIATDRFYFIIRR